MKKRSMSTSASLIITSRDGFYEGPNGEFDWPIVDEEFVRDPHSSRATKGDAESTE